MKDTIFYIERKTGEKREEFVPSRTMLYFLYNNPLGRASLHVLFKRRVVSAIGGKFMNSLRSKKQIPKFILQFKVDLRDYIVSDYTKFKHFNDFFYRKIKPAKRPIGEGVISPADGKVLAFQNIKDIPQFFIKGSDFTLETFLKSKDLAGKYKNGSMFIVRLAPTDYHRYHFPVNGQVTETSIIKGHFYSVSPIALRKSLRIFCENKRTISFIHSTDYGDVLYSEVGATMVGSILQTYTPNTIVSKGDEKGYFAFGGSTVVLLFEQGKITFAKDLIQNTQNGIETSIKMGETISE